MGEHGRKRCLVIAGAHSGVGKTTIALALMAALRRRGLVVQPFKVGPDFIDPGHHTAACGRPSYNLDTWMVGEERVRATFAHAVQGADIAIIEGVMGLFDGRGPDDPRGSTAHLARWLDSPVLLVVDAAGVAGSIAATVKGFAELDPAVRVAGVICNGVAGTRHYTYLEPAIRRHTAVVPLGWMARRPQWSIPERHLGLTTSEDLNGQNGATWEQMLEGLAVALEQTVDLDRVLGLASEPCITPAPRYSVLSTQYSPPSSRARVAVARDAAFCFYYQENLDLLREAGADLVPFSPLHSNALPDDVAVVYLGGGYPELHAERLASNEALHADLRRFHKQGGRIYAECGGLMYCGRELVDQAGRSFPMLDLLPARTVMQDRLAALGYVQWRAQAPTPLGPVGTELRGHEYHYSRLEPLANMRAAASLLRDDQPARLDGYICGGLLAGYAHLHLASNPAAVSALLRHG